MHKSFPRYYVSFYVRKVVSRHWIISVGGGIGASCSRQSDPRVGIVKDRVESLEEGLTEDVVQSISTLGADVTNNQINVIGGTINSSVLGTRPNLSVTG